MSGSVFLKARVLLLVEDESMAAGFPLQVYEYWVSDVKIMAEFIDVDISQE